MHAIQTVIVEDDPMVTEVNRQYIMAVGGFEIAGTAQTSTGALQLILTHQPELVILDIYLPDQNGLETLREIRRQDLPTDVIVVTAARDTDTIQLALRYGAIDYIVKPFKFERIKSALECYRILYHKLNTKATFDQQEIDRLTFSKNQQQETLPKGLAEVTMKQILLYLFKQANSVSAEEVAEGIGLARVTARRYLDYLAKAGRIELKIQYGSVGRPVNRYKIW
jgi:two-component system response regulator DctR